MVRTDPYSQTFLKEVIFFIFLSHSLRIKTDDEQYLSDLPRTVKFPTESSEPNALFATQEYSPVS